MVFFRSIFFVTFFLLAVFLGCNDDEMTPPEDSGISITDIDLIFNPVAGGAPLSFGASDPDGNGPKEMEVDPIVLGVDKSYQLFVKLRNDLDNVDLTDKIEEEATDYLIFFGFADELFDQPEGNGNTDTRGDQVNYIDEDENGLPIGLLTGWQTGNGGSGTFRVVIKHQPDMKTASSGLGMGTTALDLTFSVTVE